MISQKKMIPFFLFTFFLIAQPLSAKSKKSTSEDLLTANNPAIATVDSQPIRLETLEDKTINDLRKKLYGALQGRLMQAALTQLSAKYPEYRFNLNPSIKPQEIRSFYDQQNLARQGTFKELAPQIQSYLRDKRIQGTLIRLYQKAIDSKLVVSYLNVPNDFLITVPVGDAQIRGNKNAKVMVLEFSDYQCPFCSKVQPTIERLKKRYKNRVVFAYRHLPLPFHKEADEAAIAVECAAEQGKFEPYHAILFKNPRKLFPDNLKQYAKTVGVRNIRQFNKCLDQEKYRAKVSGDIAQAQSVGINGTPGFVIGLYNSTQKTVKGEVLSGALPMNAFETAIQKYLK